MKHREPDIEFAEQPQEEAQSTSLLDECRRLGRVSWKQLVTRQLPFIIWCTLLGMMYIANRYHAERIARQTAALETEVKELRAESITTADELMNLSRESVVIKEIRAHGLKIEEAKKPPYTLK